MGFATYNDGIVAWVLWPAMMEWLGGSYDLQLWNDRVGCVLISDDTWNDEIVYEWGDLWGEIVYEWARWPVRCVILHV